MKKPGLVFLLLLLVLSGGALNCSSTISNQSRGQSLQENLKEGEEKYKTGDFKGAIESWEKVLAQSKGWNRRQATDTVLMIGRAYRILGDYQKALSYLEQALEIYREIGNRNGEGQTLESIGQVYKDVGDYKAALSYYEEALKIHKNTGNKFQEGYVLSSIGLVYLHIDDYSEALSFFEKALEIIKRESGRYEAYTLERIGRTYLRLGDYTRAISYLEKSLEELGLRENKRAQGYTLGSLGAAYGELGDSNRSIFYFERALQVWREIGDKYGEGGTFAALGFAHLAFEDHARALLNYEQALKIKREIGLGTRGVEGGIGDVYLEQGRLEDAYEVFNRLGGRIRLGRYYLATKEFGKAQGNFSQSLKQSEARKMPNAQALLASYIGLGLSYEGLKEYEKAKEVYQRGVELIEKQRSVLGGGEREQYFGAKVMGFSRLEPYEGMVRVLLKEKGKDSQKAAFFYAERAKSKTFLEMLGTRNIKGGMKGDQAALGKERKYQRDLLVLRKKLEVSLERGEKAPEGELENLGKEFKEKEAEYEQFIKVVKLNNPEIASLISVNPLSIDKIRSLLDEDMTLLEYYTTKDTLYAWLVTREDVRVYEMELPEKKLENKVDEFLLPNISNRTRKPTPVITVSIGDDLNKETSESERGENRERFKQLGTQFYNSVIGPFEKDIKTKKLIIVPHGVLHRIPFSALSDGKDYLVDKYSISVLPAASVMEFVVKKRKDEKKNLLTFANPLTDYVPLEFAEAEGKGLTKLFPQNEVYYREKATETLAKAKVSGFNVIHFATHGEFNDRQPLQSGLLLAKDEANDGYLQVHEIFGMDLRNANLVTLSGCETALSKIQGGDDLVGLSRGFIYAGTPSLLATLWKVDDASTAILMELFYQNWQKGMSKPEALRQAQIALRSIPEYTHPFYWAPFVMIGDWK